jgi:hypothetical protein
MNDNTPRKRISIAFARPDDRIIVEAKTPPTVAREHRAMMQWLAENAEWPA